MSSLSRILIGLVALALLAPAAGVQARAARVPDVPRFVDETRATGVRHTYAGDWEFFEGGGVAVFDCDEDGRPDLFFAGGSEPAALYRNRSPAGRSLRFEQVASEATDLTRVIGAYPLDVDSDGTLDLAVLRHGEDVLLRGLGGCTFERANELWSFDGGDAWTTAFSATWEAGQSWPTLAFGTYIDRIDEQHLVQCGTGSLVRPAATGDAFAEPTELSPGYCALSMLFSDWDRSGRRDLRVANDRHYYYQDGEEQLWRMEPGEQPRPYTREDGWPRVQIWGMGIASQDLTGDGLPEYYVTSIGSNRLESLAGDTAAAATTAGGTPRPEFEDIAYSRSVTATTPFIGKPIHPSTSWHPEFDDVNNDGLMDLFVSKGNVDAAADSALEDPNELFLGLPDGRFRRAADRAGIVNTMRTRGAALADLNGDGLLDLVEVNRDENVILRRNVGTGTVRKSRAMGHWLAVKLHQDGANPDAVGAWIEVDSGGRTTSREVTVGGGHAGGELGPIHFGLGDLDSAEVRVTWPDGEQGAWQTVPADRIVTLQRSTGEARRPGWEAP